MGGRTLLRPDSYRRGRRCMRSDDIHRSAFRGGFSTSESARPGLLLDLHQDRPPAKTGFPVRQSHEFVFAARDGLGDVGSKWLERCMVDLASMRRARCELHTSHQSVGECHQGLAHPTSLFHHGRGVWDQPMKRMVNNSLMPVAGQSGLLEPALDETPAASLIYAWGWTGAAHLLASPIRRTLYWPKRSGLIATHTREVRPPAFTSWRLKDRRPAARREGGRRVQTRVDRRDPAG